MGGGFDLESPSKFDNPLREFLSKVSSPFGNPNVCWGVLFRRRGGMVELTKEGQDIKRLPKKQKEKGKLMLHDSRMKRD